MTNSGKIFSKTNNNHKLTIDLSLKMGRQFNKLFTNSLFMLYLFFDVEIKNVKVKNGLV